MIRSIEKHKMLHAFRPKKIFLILVLSCIIALGVFLTSCTPTTTTNNNTPPEMTKISVYRSVQGDYAGSVMPVCLVLDSDNTCEKIDIIVEFNNPDKRTISQMTINDEVFKNSVFAEDTTAERIIIKDYTINQTEGEFQLKVEKIYYQLPNEQKLVQKMSSNTVDILIAPIFNLTLDISLGREHEGYDQILVRENKYQDRVNLFLDIYMQETTDLPAETLEEGYTFGKEGYTFGGWFDQPNGQGKQYRNTDYFIDNKDLTLFAFYELTCSYSIVDGENPYAVVTGLTDSGLTNSRVEIFGEYEGVQVKEIGANAFKNMAGEKNVILPDSVIKINSRAFDSANSVTINLNNVEEIGEYAFSSCKTLNIGNIPNTVKHIGEGAFIGCTWKTKIFNPASETGLFFEESDSLVIPSTLLSIGNSAFKNSKFKSIYFWENSQLESYGEEVFANNSSLTTVWTSAAFQGTTGNVVVSNNNGLKEIGYKWFYECTSLILDTKSPLNSKLLQGLEVIGEQAFASGGLGTQSGLTKVVSVIFPNSLKRIDKLAFYNTKMENITFSEYSGFETLGDRAFQNTKLTSVEFFSLKTFGPAPFMGTPIEYLLFNLGDDADLVTYVPHSQLSIDNTGLSIGNGFSRFAKIYVPGTKVAEYNDYQTSGWWKDKNGNTDDWQPILAIESIHVIPGTGGQQISYDVTSEDEIRITNIFRSSSGNMQNIEIQETYDGKTVTEIGSYVSCDDTLASIKLPYTVKIIKDSAFRGASNLYNVIWRGTGNVELDINGAKSQILLETIEQYAFSNTALLEFRSNDRLKNIGIKAFASCKQMRTIEIINGPINDGNGQMKIEPMAFSNCGQDIGASYPMIDLTINSQVIFEMGGQNGLHIWQPVFSGAKIVDIYIFVTESNPTGYVMPVHYYSFGNSFSYGTPTVYFNAPNGYELFLPDSGTNQYFNFGYCPWDTGTNRFLKTNEYKYIVLELDN